MAQHSIYVAEFAKRDPLTFLNKYFHLKNSWGCRPNSNYLLSSVASQDTATCQNNNATGHTARMSIEHTSFTKAWAHRHRQTVHTFSFL